MEINGIPLHPLVVHAAVVLTPVAGLVAILHGLVPRWRWLTRWPLLLAAVVGAAVTYVATLSGSDLKARLGIGGNEIEIHQMWAGRLQVAMWVLVAVALIAWWVLPFKNPLAHGVDREARVSGLARPLMLVLPLVGIVVLVLVFLTGEAGARTVWGGR
ncbi:MAG: hypothetical protein M3Y66_01550 [Actinomycetota bacterium]|nr:hypothetical protein [Actinomycetota bacterium]